MATNETFIGQKFGRLVILSVFKNGRYLMFETRCECGTVSSKHTANVRTGRTVSCGCRERETWAEKDKGFNSNHSKTYCSWENMHNRCNPNNRQHVASYAGITVCSRWTGEDGYKNFLTDMGDRPDGTSLDRRDNSKGYEKENCRWATRKQQQNNRRVCVRTQDGSTVEEYAKERGLSYMQAWHRLRRSGELAKAA